MSYKHNDLWAMRERYWSDEHSTRVQEEKALFRTLLEQYKVCTSADLNDAKYLFFSLPSIIIVKGYALGFQHPKVYELMVQYIEKTKTELQQKQPVKIQFKL